MCRAFALPAVFRSAAWRSGIMLTVGFLSLIAAPLPVGAHGEGSEDVIEHFDEHLDAFTAEVQALSVQVDATVEAYRAGDAAAPKLRALIEKWESVVVHEVIETKVVRMYPPIWQGIYAMQQAVEKELEAQAMAAAGERTKAALWEAMGALRLLAQSPHLAHADTTGSDGASVAIDYEAVDNDIRLTGDDNMRFDKTRLYVRVGEPVTLTFVNIGELPKDVMGHNVVVLKRGVAVEPFALAAAEHPEKGYVPPEAKFQRQIVAETAMLGPGESETITFTLEEPGTYPFLCSFVGHFRLMQGNIHAVSDPDEAPVAAILERLETAVTTYREGNPDAANEIVFDTYNLIFEGLEGDLITRNPELVSQLELDFNAGLPELFNRGAPAEEVKAKFDAMRKRLERAAKLLENIEAARDPVF
ncbi:MAG: plastocyanin/azurin family copper-binding protein [Opitutales bacterium]